MRRLALPLMTGLGLTLALAACGSDTSGPSCGAGTHLENGTCVPDNTSDTFTPTDTFDQPDSTTTTDTGGTTTDTLTNFDTSADTAVPNECTEEEAGVRDVGAGCSKDCQCRQDIGLKCQTFDYYLSGFYFCTKKSDGTLSDLDGHVSLLFPSACYNGTPQSQRPPIYQHKCSSLDDCKALSAQYTHCGTDSFDWISGGSHTQCPQDTGGSPGTLQTQATCIIDSLEPFVP